MDLELTMSDSCRTLN